MIDVIKAASRGQTRTGWLDSKHTFSFADYYDPRRMGFSVLRVLNDDIVAPGQGFGAHPHANMEIVTYLLEGQLAHRDSGGGGSTIHAGEVQRMSAGTGVLHSELNPSNDQPVRLLQIWLEPEWRGLEPSYEQRAFPEAKRRAGLVLVASRDGRAGSLTVHQKVDLWAGLLVEGARRELPLRNGRRAFVQVARGKVSVNGTELAEGDGAALSGENAVDLEGVATDSEVLVFDLP